MFHDRIQTKPVPKWTICDRVIDITDIWTDVMDPKNEDGAIVTAFLHGNRYDDTMEVRGIRIEDYSGTTYWDRAYCTRHNKLFDAIWKAEQYEMQAGDYGADDRYDAWKEAR